jgi:hypothetical protein
MKIIKGNLKSLNYNLLCDYFNLHKKYVVIDIKNDSWQEEIVSSSSNNLFEENQQVFIKNPNKDLYDFIKENNYLINNNDIYIIQEDNKSKPSVKLEEIEVKKLSKKDILEIAVKFSIKKDILKIYENKLSDNYFVLYNQLNIISNISKNHNPNILDYDLEPRKIYLLTNDFINMNYSLFKETYNHYFLTMSEIGIFYFIVSSLINIKSSYYNTNKEQTYFIKKQLEIIKKTGINKFNDLLIFMSDIDLKYKKGIIKQELVLKLIFD